MDAKSPESVVRAIYDAWVAGRAPRELLAADMEYVNPEDAVETGTRRGRGALRAPFDAYEEFTVTPEEYIAVPPDRVVVLAKVHIRARGSGIEVDTRQGYLWTVHDGRAVRFEWFRHPEQALEAAGIRPSG